MSTKAFSPGSSSASAATDLALIASFAALIIVFAFVAIPVGAAGVPIVIQNAVIILSALVLGARRGFLAVLLFLVVGLALPVLAGGRTTIAALGGPTVGYIVGYLLCAIVVGLIAYRALPKQRLNQLLLFSLAAIAGFAVQYISGSVGLMVRADMGAGEAFASQLAFVVPDLIKCAFMVAIALGVHAAIPSLLSRNRA